MPRWRPAASARIGSPAPRSARSTPRSSPAICRMNASSGCASSGRSLGRARRSRGEHPTRRTHARRGVRWHRSWRAAAAPAEPQPSGPSFGRRIARTGRGGRSISIGSIPARCGSCSARSISVTGAETYFDNDRHVLGLDHVLASSALAGHAAGPRRWPALWRQCGIGGLARRCAAGRHAVFRDRRLRPGAGRAWRAQPVGPRDRRVAPQPRSAPDDRAARRAGAAGAERDADIRKCLAEASEATMTILHLVHEGSAEQLADQDGGFLAGDAMHASLAGRRKRRRHQPGASALAGAAAAPARRRRARIARRRRRPAALEH